jgi:hypothetical protein
VEGEGSCKEEMTMLPTITLNPELRAQLNGLHQQVQVVDESGQQVGVFLPLDYYKTLLRNIQIPFSDEEIDQLRKAGGGGSLADFWKRLGVS